jgi:hypothetical protein
VKHGIGLLLALGVVLALAPTSTGSTLATAPPSRAAEPAPVASLEPAKTEALWRRLVAARERRAQAPADCRPLRGVFYAATDYLRLATKLAATASPCAQYYISIPPLVADKTKPRPNAASRVRALGPNFHTMAEVHFTTWSRWVQSTGSSWYTAGVTARERMSAAGHDVATGDTWVVNELSTAVRRNTGNARANIRELLRGLYEGNGARVRGAIFVVGVGQRTSDTSLLQTNLQNWYSDAAFWTDMDTYVSDWGQEVYGDARNHGVPGAAEETRREYANDYLQHPLVLAGVGPPTIDTARSYLQTSYSPLANAAWERETGYGWTMVPAEQMGAYVSSQVHALRYFSATTGQPQDHWGFAWAPRNAGGISAGEFAARSGLVLDRLAAAIRDSAETTDSADPGGAACGPPGQSPNCAFDVEGATLNEAWKSFRTWTQPVLGFATPLQTIPAGSVSAPMNLALVTSSGLAVTTPTAMAVTVTSSSSTGTFSTSPAGPWSPTAALTIAAGTRTTVPFFYQDTKAGGHTLTAAAEGATSGTQVLTVLPGPLTTFAVTPATADVPARGSQRLVATGIDSYENVFPLSATWSLEPPTIGILSTPSGSETTFMAGRTLGPASITATASNGAESVSAAATLRVVPGRLSVAFIAYRVQRRGVLVSLWARDAAGKSVSDATVLGLVRRNGRAYVSTRAVTGPAGRTTYRIPLPKLGGCLSTTVRRASAAGFAWDGKSPRNRICLPKPR